MKINRIGDGRVPYTRTFDRPPSSNLAKALRQCAQDPDDTMRLAAALHPRTPWGAPDTLAHAPDAAIREHARENLDLQRTLGRMPTQ